MRSTLYDNRKIFCGSVFQVPRNCRVWVGTGLPEVLQACNHFLSSTRTKAILPQSSPATVVLLPLHFPDPPPEGDFHLYSQNNLEVTGFTWKKKPQPLPSCMGSYLTYDLILVISCLSPTSLLMASSSPGQTYSQLEAFLR